MQNLAVLKRPLNLGRLERLVNIGVPILTYVAAVTFDHLTTLDLLSQYEINLNLDQMIHIETNPTLKFLIENLGVRAGIAVNYLAKIGTVGVLGSYKSGSKFVNKFIGRQLFYIFGLADSIAAFCNFYYLN